MEAEFLQWLSQRLPGDERLPFGLSSDTALLPGVGPRGLIATTDALTDGVDFVLGVDDPRRIGRKALAVNLSDLAAAAARPLAVLISLVLPRNGAAQLARELYEGLLPLAETFQVAIAGGDTNTWDGGLVINVTALGEPIVPGGWNRTGARPGDWILVTGEFGGSRLGKQFDFTPRLAEAMSIASRYSIQAATDVSDGLSLDLHRLVTASGCGAVIDAPTIPIAAAAHQFARQQADGRSAWEHALSDGEDFELILVAARDVAERLLADQQLNVRLTHIGECVAAPGLWVRGEPVADGLGPDRPPTGRETAEAATQPRPLVPRGYEHGAQQ